MNHFHWYVGLRFIRSKRRDGFLSFLTIFSMLGMILGVAALIIVLSVMNGFQTELKDKVLSFIPHATLQDQQPIENWQEYAQIAQAHPHVLAASGFTEVQGLLVSSYSNRGAVVQGIEPKDLYANTGFDKSTLAPELLAKLDNDRWGIIMGVHMASSLGLNVGDKVKFIVPEQTSINFSGLNTQDKRFTLVGIFKVRSEVDNSVALINIKDAASILRIPKNSAMSIQIKTDDLFLAKQYAQEVADSVDRYFTTLDWTRQHGNLFAAIKMERRMVALLLAIVILVASFNILTSLMMVVNEKQGVIAILRTMGAKPIQIMKIFLVQGTFIGVIGTCIGVVLGTFIAYMIPTFATFLEVKFGIYVLDPNVYHTSSFPSDPHTFDIFLVACFSLLLSFLVTILPALKASYVPPAQALRYEV
ncbi:MAG: lipoprotein-releasing ABC transporter permease subunit [Saccharospirillaceae bacterium]|nr:lipoprotein-releasing ABC transporter permease subunit [Pseudomonadales bacterium]NRB78285.1 lipoprotein-releasing ABC transporter permease subunit [Saccharospirillaceae bacterium]